jgi:hypothetical protein
VIEVKYDGFPAGAGWTLRQSPGTLIAGQSTGNFRTESCAVSKTAYTAEGAPTFEMTDTYGDGICCQYGACEFKITEFRDVARPSFDMVDRSTDPTFDYRLDVAYDDCPYETS